MGKQVAMGKEAASTIRDQAEAPGIDRSPLCQHIKHQMMCWDEAIAFTMLSSDHFMGSRQRDDIFSNKLLDLVSLMGF